MLRIKLLELLHRGLSDMGQSLDQRTELQLIRYIEMLFHQNRELKLSSICDLDAMVTRHLLDSLSIIPYLKGNTILDVGTGAGLPGIPLSIVLPHQHFCLVDNKYRKIQFLQSVVERLSLRNISLVNRSVEAFRVKSLFESVISRSFNTLGDFITLTHHLLKPGGQLLAMKGVYPLTELKDIHSSFKIINVYPVKIPGFSDERHVVELMKQRSKEIY